MRLTEPEYNCKLGKVFFGYSKRGHITYSLINKIIIRSGLKQGVIAKRIGVSQVHLSNYVNGIYVYANAVSEKNFITKILKECKN